jgi:subtilase family protein
MPGGRLLRRFVMNLAAAAVIAGAAVLPPAVWSPIAPAVADDDGGGSHGSGGGGHGDGGSDASGDGSSNSGPGGGDDSGENEVGDEGGDVGGSGGGRGAQRDGHDYIRGEVVVANLSSRARREIGQLGFVILEERPFAALGLTVARLRVPPRMASPAARTLLAARYPDLLVDLNALYRPQGQRILPAPDYAARLIGWGHAAAGCGAGLRIGVLDTAVDGGIPALRGAKILQRSFISADAQHAGREHGTAVAAILVGQAPAGGNGLLPGAALSVGEVFAQDAAGQAVAEVLALVGGLNWLVEQDIPVINLSLAGDPNALVAFALRRAAARRSVVVAAAGNGGPEAAPAFPASEPSVIGVTALDSRSQPYAAANRGDYVDFAAPGVRIWTPGADADGSYVSGTSFAAPYVTAAIGALIARAGAADPARVTTMLAATAIDLGSPGKDPVFGWGLIQAANPCVALTQQPRNSAISSE